MAEAGNRKFHLQFNYLEFYNQNNDLGLTMIFISNIYIYHSEVLVPHPQEENRLVWVLV